MRFSLNTSGRIQIRWDQISEEEWERVELLRMFNANTDCYVGSGDDADAVGLPDFSVLFIPKRISSIYKIKLEYFQDPGHYTAETYVHMCF